MSVADILTQRGIASITIIDDAFDPITADRIGRPAIEDFFAELEQNNELAQAVEGLGLRVDAVEDLTDASLQTLFAGRNLAGDLADKLNILFGQETYSARRDVEQIRDNLLNLRLKVSVSGSAAPISPPDTKIILLDYYLGPISTPVQSVAAAVARAKDIYVQHPDPETRPVIILMSSERLSDDQVKRFREDSKLLGGMFHHIPKEMLKRQESLERKLMAVSMSLPVAHVIEALIGAVERSIKTGQDLFVSTMRSLSLEDYIYIQRLSVKEDGQPFGEYLLWLFSSEFHRRVFENEDVLAKQADVDALKNLDLPPRQIRPSIQLAEMYKSALFRTMNGEIATHPLGNAIQDFPLLSLGDIFAAGSQLYMVMNPECDLAFSPVAEKRAFPASKSILMIPGSLDNIQRSVPADAAGKPHTEMFVFNGETFRITWDPKRVISIKYGDIRQWATDGGYRRDYRLRLLYALQIQHEFVSDFGRIGKPSAPPIFQAVRLEVFGSDNSAKSKLVLGPLDVHAALVSVKGATRCALDLSFIEELSGVIAPCREALETRVATLSQNLQAGDAGGATLSAERRDKFQAKIERAQAQLAALRSFAEDPTAQVEFIANPFDVCGPGESISLSKPTGLFSVYVDKAVEINFQPQEALIIRLSVLSEILASTPGADTGAGPVIEPGC